MSDIYNEQTNKIYKYLSESMQVAILCQPISKHESCKKRNKQIRRRYNVYMIVIVLQKWVGWNDENRKRIWSMLITVWRKRKTFCGTQSVMKKTQSRGNFKRGTYGTKLKAAF